MTLQQLLAMLLERGNAMQSFWGFYITVSLGMLAFFGSSQRPRRLAVLVSIAFFAFAVVNVSGMLDIANQRETLWTLLANFKESTGLAGTPLSEAELSKAMIDVVKPPASHGIRTFHVSCDLAVLIAIWFLTLWRRGEPKVAAAGKPA